MAETDKILREVIKDHLIPMLPGSEIVEFRSISSTGQTKVVCSAPNAIDIFYSIKGQKVDKVVRLKRGLKYYAEDRNIALLFAAKVNDIFDAYSRPARDIIMDAIAIETVADIVRPDAKDILTEVLVILNRWSQETYEGQRITAAIGIGNFPSSIHLDFRDVLNYNFSKVVSNGYDQIMIANYDGRFVGYDEPSDTNQETYSPIRFTGLANWTAPDDSDKIVLALTKSGEILIFKGGKLVFAKRRGKWHYFAHQAIVNQMGLMGNAHWTRRLRSAVYMTCLDISFAKSGGCIGIKRAGFAPESQIDDSDLINKQCSAKAQALTKIIADKPFYDLPRMLRLSLAGIDGVTVIDNKGKILTAGAILRKVECDQSGGGRLAAARALADNGLGIKISSDGEVYGYSGLLGNGENKVSTVFTVG